MKRKEDWRAVVERRRKWGRRERERIMEALGSRCNFCGSKNRLEFDSVEPCKYHAVSTDFVGRMCYYRREFVKGNLQVLCRHCNAVKGDRRNYFPPFSRKPPEPPGPGVPVVLPDADKVLVVMDNGEEVLCE